MTHEADLVLKDRGTEVPIGIAQEEETRRALEREVKDCRMQRCVGSLIVGHGACVVVIVVAGGIVVVVVVVVVVVIGSSIVAITIAIIIVIIIIIAIVMRGEKRRERRAGSCGVEIRCIWISHI